MAKKEPVDERNLDGSGAPTIPWARARERFEEDAGISPTHWLATVRPDGRPHVMPVWTIWVDGAFYFVSGATTRKAKNLAHNAHCVITVASSGLDLVVEGEATKVGDEARLQQIADAYAAQGWHPTVRNGVFYAADASTKRRSSPIRGLRSHSCDGLRPGYGRALRRNPLALLARNAQISPVRQVCDSRGWTCDAPSVDGVIETGKGEETMAEIEYTGVPQRARLQAAAEAAAWGRLTELRQHLYGAATKRMLEAANLQPGDQVLDIAAGTGDQSRLAAQLVGPQGSVLATDISQEMLVVAAQLAKQEGLSTITTRAMNAEQLDLPESSYDAVISRFGLMLISDRHQALTEIRRVLKPGGRLAALVWSKPERNPLFTLEEPIVAKYLQVEEPRSDAFSLADAALFASTLTEAGFQEVQVQAIALPFRFPSFEVLTAWWGSSLKKALATLEPEPGRRMLAEVRQAVCPFEGPQGIVAPAEVLLGVAMKERW